MLEKTVCDIKCSLKKIIFQLLNLILIVQSISVTQKLQKIRDMCRNKVIHVILIYSLSSFLKGYSSYILNN